MLFLWKLTARGYAMEFPDPFVYCLFLLGLQTWIGSVSWSTRTIFLGKRGGDILEPDSSFTYAMWLASSLHLFSCEQWA
jgi:hypothetical protein